jgi:hypothetical protein
VINPDTARKDLTRALEWSHSSSSQCSMGFNTDQIHPHTGISSDSSVWYCFPDFKERRGKSTYCNILAILFNFPNPPPYASPRLSAHFHLRRTLIARYIKPTVNLAFRFENMSSNQLAMATDSTSLPTTPCSSCHNFATDFGTDAEWKPVRP